MSSVTKKSVYIGITICFAAMMGVGGCIALGGPMRNMFSASVGTGTMGQNQAALSGGIYGGECYITGAPTIAVCPPPVDREQYARIVENDFQDATVHPLSTFSIDVDRASYANVRRFLTSNTLPPHDAVRIEELINYFPYNYDGPSGGAGPFAIHAEAAACPWNADHLLVRIGLKGKEIPREKLPSSNFVFLIDVSGSMDSPDKLPLLKSSFRMLVDHLAPTDRVAIVVYAGASGLALPSTPGSDRAKILAAIDQLQPGGSTAGAEGIVLAYRIAAENFVKGGNNRVILATDGDFNVGISSDGELVRLIEEKRKEGVFLSVLGFGTGNIQDAKMEQLADNGNGNYAYIDGENEARKVLVKELGGTLHTIAKDVKIQVEFNPAHVKAYRLIGYENRALAAEDFSDDKKDAGELGEGHTVTAMYELIPAGNDESVRSARPLRYQTVARSADENAQRELFTFQLRYKLPDEEKSRLLERAVMTGENSALSEDFRFAAAVAEFGMLLRESKLKGTATWESAGELANGSLGRDEDGCRAEFLELVRKAAIIPAATRGAAGGGVY
ncbi:MAG: VWA domain-containing protein [Candidatus Hydrogenedentota bacterium]